MYIAAPRWRWDIEVVLELDNALAALDWALASDGDDVLAARIASGLLGLWGAAGLGMYGQRYVDAAIGRIVDLDHPVVAARLLLAQHRFLDGSARIEAMKRAIALLGDGSSEAGMLAMAQLFLGYALMIGGDYQGAGRGYDAASDLLQAVGLQRSSLYSSLLRSRSELANLQGLSGDATSILADALLLAEDLEDDWLISQCQSVLAEIAFSEGDAQRAVALGKEAVANAGRVRSSYQLSALNNLACYHLALGEIDAAETNARMALHLAHTTNQSALCTHIAVQHLATVAALRHDRSRAARLLGYVEAWYEQVGFKRDPTDQKGYDMLTKSLRSETSDDEIALLAAQGARYTQGAAIGEALS
jgi:hypothetical protein